MTAEDQPKVIIDPGNPKAGRGGVLPPGPKFQPGRSGNPGGRRPGADVGAAMLRRLAQNPDEDGIGEGARALADTLIDVAMGLRAPDSIDSKVALAIVDRASGPVVKEINSTNTHTLEGIELRERGAPVELPE